MPLWRIGWKTRSCSRVTCSGDGRAGTKREGLSCRRGIGMAIPPPKPRTESETGRLEAFSDGVFAVAITLLALDLGVPGAGAVKQHHGLARALLDEWPVYLAYVLSFVTILIMWVNHHNLFKFIQRTDHL